MKKVVLVVMMACFISQVDAQVRFGIKGGVNFENFDYKNAKEELTIDNSIGWQVGALLQFQTSVGMGIQPEMLYTVKKADVKNGVKNESNSIHYFEIPLNVQLGFDLAFIRPYVMAGPYFSYAVQFGGDVFKSHINKFDWGVGLGAGIELSNLQIGARYSWGLQNVSCVKELEMKNNTFTLSLALLF